MICTGLENRYGCRQGISAFGSENRRACRWAPGLAEAFGSRNRSRLVATSWLRFAGIARVHWGDGEPTEPKVGSSNLSGRARREHESSGKTLQNRQNGGHTNRRRKAPSHNLAHPLREVMATKWLPIGGV